ncbi:hypothetical protein [Quadrisphaera setariae]|uniref:Uncharacterized protein n=1 Tax=Quadrisphaera setariae TaxID=2593304 RepID=A0A5C8Z2X7_9ACTN|nr:hypothetical protein [Quadrisphaera setariae]TXR51573.1 hypothetical protein FMM08_22245 [Quadrisphaera setariae]
MVLDAEGLGTAGVAGSRAGDVPVVPAVNAAAYEALVGAANNLNQLTRYSHQNEALAPGVGEAVAQVVAAARAVRGRRVFEPAEPAEPVVEPVEQAGQPDGPLEPVDPWVSRPRRRVEPATGPDVEADVDASPDGGTDSGSGTDGGSEVPVSSEVSAERSSAGSSSAAEEDRRPAGWEAMSLRERAQWLQRSGRAEER